MTSEPNLMLRDFQPCFNGWDKWFTQENDPTISYHKNLTGLTKRTDEITAWSSWSSPDGYNYNFIYFTDSKSSSKTYYHDSMTVLRVKHFGLILGTPTIVLPADASNALFKAFKILTFANFWKTREIIPETDFQYKIQQKIEKAQKVSNEDRILNFAKNLAIALVQIVFWNVILSINQGYHELTPLSLHEKYDFKTRVVETIQDLSFILKLIPTVIGRELSAIWGLAFPLDGAKVYAAFQKLQDGFVLAPCFEPMGFHLPTAPSPVPDSSPAPLERPVINHFMTGPSSDPDAI